MKGRNNCVKLTVTLSGIKLTGNTYPYRQVFKELGFKWDPETKAWWLDFPFSSHDASVTIPDDDFESFLDHLDEFVNELKSLGFRFVSRESVCRYYGIYAITVNIIKRLRERGVPITIQ